MFIIKRFYKFNFTDRIQISLIVSFLYVLSLSLLLKLKSLLNRFKHGIILFFSIFNIISGRIVGFQKKYLYSFKKVPSLLFIVVLMTGLIILNVDMVVERLGMMFICFITYDLYLYSSEIKNKSIRSLVRLSLMLLFTCQHYFSKVQKSF